MGTEAQGRGAGPCRRASWSEGRVPSGGTGTSSVRLPPPPLPAGSLSAPVNSPPSSWSATAQRAMRCRRTSCCTRSGGRLRWSRALSCACGPCCPEPRGALVGRCPCGRRPSVLPSSPVIPGLPAWAGGSSPRVRAQPWCPGAALGTSRIITGTGTSKVWTWGWTWGEVRFGGLMLDRGRGRVGREGTGGVARSPGKTAW